MEFVLGAHSVGRYLVLLAAAIGVIKSLVNLAMRSSGTGADPIIATVFVGLFDVQAFLGVLIILLGGLRGPLHPLFMFIALVLAHVLSTTVKRSNQLPVNILRLALYAAPLAIILLGLWIIIPI